MRLSGPRTRLGLAIASAVIVVDRANKHWLVDGLDLPSRPPIEAMPFLDIVMVWNRGVSYGLLQQETEIGRYALIAFAIVVSGVLVFWLARTASGATAVALGLIIGGALSNMVDRVIWGAVADFYRLHGFGVSWYVFNLADAAIVAGVLILLYISFQTGHKSAGNPA